MNDQKNANENFFDPEETMKRLRGKKIIAMGQTIRVDISTTEEDVEGNPEIGYQIKYTEAGKNNDRIGDVSDAWISLAAYEQMQCGNWLFLTFEKAVNATGFGRRVGRAEWDGKWLAQNSVVDILAKQRAARRRGERVSAFSWLGSEPLTLNTEAGVVDWTSAGEDVLANDWIVVPDSD